MAHSTPYIFYASTKSRPNRPESRHLLQFYCSDTDLLPSLCSFIVSGVKRGEVSIVIATKSHQIKLCKAISEAGINYSGVVHDGQLIILDAEQTLKKFMVNDLPDRIKFFETIGPLIAEKSLNGSSINMFGEMVAVLWKASNKSAVMQLEGLWKELGNYHRFTLLCAYPELHFVMDVEARREISRLHQSFYPGI